MPCDSVRRTPVRYSRCKNKLAQLPLLAKALTNLGYSTYHNSRDGVITFGLSGGWGDTATYTAPTGEFNIPSTFSGWDLNRVNQEYSKEVVRAQASRFGWTLTEETAGKDCAAAFSVTHRRME